ncbi:hypothetical protein Tco_1291253 [Tanacetum coccineum]
MIKQPICRIQYAYNNKKIPRNPPEAIDTNIMAAGSKERPPMLGPGRYSQWHSRFLRYLDTKSNGEYLRKCIFEGPYMPTNVLIAAVEAAENILPVAAHEEVDQNAAECVDERAALANLTLDMEENKTVLKQLKKANASLTQELKECKTNLDESSRAELEKYTALNDLTSDYKILQTKLNDTLGLLAIKNIDIKEGLKTKTYEISVVNQKHDELVKKSLLNRSQFEGQLKEKTKVISDLKVKEGKDIDTMIETV